MQRAIWVCAVGAAVSWAALGDTITIDGTTYENVYVKTTPRMIYVEIPEDGTVMYVSRDKVAEGDLVIDPDWVTRDALHAQWVENNAKLPKRTTRTEPEDEPAPPAPTWTRPARPEVTESTF